MVAGLAWTFIVKKKVDLITKKEIPLDIEYEPKLNLKPLPFAAMIEI